MAARDEGEPGRVIGRYALYDEIAAGGMATVHFGRLLGPAGFSRTVAIKRLHPMFAKDPEFVSMFLDEARLAARVRHPNVVATLDIVPRKGELFVVMEYVLGESFARLCRVLRERGEVVPPSIAAGVMMSVLHGLHAAHEAKSEQGESLDIVHRDVSPQNILVGVDGVPRVVDFGVAKAVGRLQTTQEGQIKGKTSYMSPEQLRGRNVDRRADVYAASVVLWEALAGERLFTGDHTETIMAQVLEKVIPAPGTVAGGVSPELDAIVMRGLSRSADRRYSTAREMALALELTIAPATARAIGDWVVTIAGGPLDERSERVAEIERSSSVPALDSVRLRGAASEEGEPLPMRVPTEPPATAAGVVTQTSSARVPRFSWRLAFVGFAIASAAASIAILRVRPGQARAVASPVADSSTAGSQNPVSPVPLASAPGSVNPPTAAPAPSVTPTLKPRGRPLVRSRPAPVPNCDPPYTIDSTGIRVANPKCL
jgi:serine/threonine protein kinase